LRVSRGLPHQRERVGSEELSIFTEQEIVRRQRAIAEGMKERGIDACLLTSADNVYYASGVPLLSEWGRPMWCVLSAGGGGGIIGAEIELESMTRDSHGVEIRAYGDGGRVHDLALESARGILGAGGLSTASRIGIEKHALPLHLAERLRELLPDVELVEVGDVLAAARLLKSPEEIEILTLGGHVAKIGANAFIEALAPGSTELTVAAHAKLEMDRALGALHHDVATSTYVYAQFGEHSLSPHRHPSARRLRRGDVVALNVFPVVWGYCVELERTLVFGAPTARQDELLDVLEESFDYGKAACVPGKKFSELHEECSDIIRKAGLGDGIRHGTGHAHGIMVGAASREEGGEIREYNEGRLTAGMLNSIEPGFYLPDEGGFRHSDVMLLTADGSRCITEFPTRVAL
jgi:Xaa-Pro aminopeptidase